MTPKSQAKKYNPILEIPIFDYFLTLKKYHANKYTILSFNRIMRIYSNVYNYVIYLIQQDVPEIFQVVLGEFK